MEKDNINFKKADRNRKISLVVLSIFSFSIIIMWFVNFQNNLKDPFRYKGDISLATQRNEFSCVGPDCQGEMSLSSDNLELKFIDTDGDGISDWDELFIYGTSPYLEDTSGDGISDYDAIFIYNKDPLCPSGQDCGDYLYEKDSQGASLNMNQDFNNMMDLLGSLEDSNIEVTADDIPVDFSPDRVSPSFLRNMLLEDGMAKEDLDQISDEKLLEIYREAFSNF